MHGTKITLWDRVRGGGGVEGLSSASDLGWDKNRILLSARVYPTLFVKRCIHPSTIGLKNMLTAKALLFHGFGRD